MKNPIKSIMGRRPNSAADIENELARLGQKLADHQRRHSELLQSLEDAKEARRSVLADEDSIIVEATANVRRLEADVAEHARMIEEYQLAVSGAQERFRAAQETETRQAAAARLEQIASKMDAAAPELEKAVAAVASAARKMISAIPSDLEVFPGYYAGRLDQARDAFGRTEAVATVVAEMLMGQCPELITRFHDDGYRAGLFRIMTPEDPQPSYESGQANYDALASRRAVEALISGRLRDRAAQVVAGERKPTLDDIKPVYKYVPPPPIPEVAIFAKQSFSYVDNDFGGLALVGARWHRWVPEPVAKVAIARGFALAIDSPEGQKAFAAEKEYRESSNGISNSSLTPDQCFPLGDVLGLVAERKRLDAEFDARNAPADEIVEEVERVLG